MKKYRILLLDTKPSNPNHYICLGIEDALGMHPEVDIVYRANLGNAIAMAKELRCNLFFAFDGEELNHEICKRLKQICGRSLAWFTEDPYELPKNILNSNLFDIVFTNDLSSVNDYKNLAFHLPLAASKKLQFHKVAEDTSALYDLFFAGTAWPNRVHLIDQIAKKIKGIQLKIALSSNEHLPKFTIPLKQSSYNWKTPNIEFSRFSNLSRATLSINRDFSTCKGAKTKATTPGPRLFEVAMAGGFQLSDASKEELEEFFLPNKEIITFDSIDECKDKLQYYLINPDKRIKIAKAAQRRALKEHSYSNRISFILQKVGELKSKRIMPAKIDRPKILMVAHNMIHRGPWGGTEVYQEWIRKNLSDKFEFYFYTPKDLNGTSYLLQDANLKVIKEFSVTSPPNRHQLSCIEREKIFSKILIDYEISSVHFQHLLNHTPSLPIIAKSLGVGVLMSLHDFYSICDNFNLVGATGKYCGLETITEAGCDSCLASMHNALSGSQSIRRNFFKLVLDSCDSLQVNSLDTKNKHEKIFGKSISLSNKITQIGVPIEKNQSSPKNLKFSFQKNINAHKLNIALIGNFTAEKGGHFFIQIFNQLKDWPIHFYIFGRIDKPFDEIFHNSTFSNVTVHGIYKPYELRALLTGMHASIHNSIWPETYCLTLSEAWNAGILPIVSDIGALGERVTDSVNGLKFPVENIGRAVDILKFLASSPNTVSEIVKNADISDLSYGSTHKKWLSKKYLEISKIHPKNLKKLSGKYNSEISLKDCGVFLNNIIWLLK